MARSLPSYRRALARSCAVVLVVASAAVGTPRRAHAAASPPAWTRPVPGPVVAPFRVPPHRFAAGHRGADLAAPAGAQVRSAGEGEVVFAGVIAGASHVVVLHPGGLRTSYSFLAAVAVRLHERVAGGAVVGTAGGRGEGHEPGVVHFGLRSGSTYLDPMLLFRPVDLAKAVRLVPVDEPPQAGFEPPAQEARTLADALAVHPPVPQSMLAGGSDGGVLGFLGGAWGTASGWLDGAGDAARSLGGVARRAYEQTPLAVVVRDATEAARRFGAWLAQRARCTSTPPPLDGTGGSGHRLMAVAGIQSHTDARTGRTMALDTRALGYGDDEVDWYSYADAPTYAPADTTGDLDAAARRLAVQLREVRRREPFREVDLIGHSQGGVVIDLFLQRYYDPADPGFPPLGTVVTLSSPHSGAPLAGAVADVGASRAGRGVLDVVSGLAGDAAPRPAAESIRQLSPSAREIRAVRSGGMPDQIEITAIGSADDVLVPANHAGRPDATNVTVNPAGFDDHSAILRDRGALAAVRLALERRPPPCVSLLDGLRGAVEPVLISRFERTVGQAAGAALAAAGG